MICHFVSEFFFSIFVNIENVKNWLVFFDIFIVVSPIQIEGSICQSRVLMYFCAYWRYLST